MLISKIETLIYKIRKIGPIFLLLSRHPLSSYYKFHVSGVSFMILDWSNEQKLDLLNFDH